MRRLLIRPGAIGDCILSIPALRHLKATYTEIWVPTAVVPLIQFADKVRSISSTGIDLLGIGDLGIPRELEETLRSFDSIVSWYGANRPEFRDAMRSFGVPCEFHTALPPADHGAHATDFFARQVGAPTGCIPQIAVEPSSKRTPIVIHPFSGSPRKNWPMSSFVELASKLDWPVEWTAGPEEELPAPLAPTCFTNLLDLAQWLKGARLYIGNDSGITHLAAAAGVKTLSLFGETKPQIWAPRGANVAVLQCTPLATLSVERVLRAVNRLLY